LKLGSKPAPAPAPEPQATEKPAPQEPSDDIDFGVDSQNTQDTGNKSPFEKEPFDAGVEADEESDPKKFIEQLSGKLGQSLRKYSDEQGQPDFKLEKFAINSVISATHASEMNPKDQKDIIKKIKSSGKDGNNDDMNNDGDTETTNIPDGDNEEPSDETTDQTLNEMSLKKRDAKILIKMYDNGGEAKKQLVRFVTYEDESDSVDEKDLAENRKYFLECLEDYVNEEDLENFFKKLEKNGIVIPDIESDSKVIDIKETDIFLENPKKNNMFQEGSNDILDEKDDRCTRIAKRKYDVWPSAYASGAVVKCRQGKIWKGVDENAI
jgi:hypothetical protein